MADYSYTNHAMHKYLANAKSKSKWHFMPYIIATKITLIIFFYSNIYISIGIGIILFFIAKIFSKGLKYPTLFVPAEFDTRTGILVFMGYSNLEEKKDFLEGIGKLVWRFARTIVIENIDNALGYHTSRDQYGVIIISNNDYFYKDFIHTANKVKSIVLCLDDYDESLKVLKLIKENKLHTKTIVIMEPENEFGWKALREKALKEKINLPYFNPEGMLYFPKKDFSIYKSFIFESGTIEIEHISKIIKTNYSEDEYQVKNCFPKDDYIETYHFSPSFQQDFPETINIYENYTRSLSYRDLSLPSHYIKELIYSLIDKRNSNNAFDELIEKFSDESFQHLIDIISMIEIENKQKIETLQKIKESLRLKNKNELLNYLEECLIQIKMK